MKKILFLIIIITALGCAIEAVPSPEVDLSPKESKTENNNPNLVQYKVIRVIDGDTVELKNGERLRYNDIDTPETVHPSKPIECYGPEASKENKELVEGEIILVEFGNPKKHTIEATVIKDSVTKAYPNNLPPNPKRVI